MMGFIRKVIRCKPVYKVKDSIDMLKRADYKPAGISVFMICNWKIPYKECVKKLDVMKVWGILVNDCYWDNQVFPNVIPEYWTKDQLVYFRAKCRKHNQIIAFRGVDPEL
jgi:hypothetical protein